MKEFVYNVYWTKYKVPLFACGEPDLYWNRVKCQYIMTTIADSQSSVISLENVGESFAAYWLKVTGF